MTGWYVQWTKGDEVGYVGPFTRRSLVRTLKKVVIEASGESTDPAMIFDNVAIGRFEGSLFRRER